MIRLFFPIMAFYFEYADFALLYDEGKKNPPLAKKSLPLASQLKKITFPLLIPFLDLKMHRVITWWGHLFNVLMGDHSTERYIFLWKTKTVRRGNLVWSQINKIEWIPPWWESRDRPLKVPERTWNKKWAAVFLIKFLLRNQTHNFSLKEMFKKLS